MFKNPLKKFQQGGQVSQEQQEMLAAFVEWLPTAVEEFKNMQPEQIVEALNGMTKTPEGQKQVQSLMERFKQELNSPKMRFKEGDKIHQFICKHAKGGHVADCGCKQEGGSLEGQYGTIDVDSRNNIRRAIDNIIGNSSTLSSVQRGFRNFRESAPGKVMTTLLPNPNSEVGMIGAALPVKGYRIPASNIIESPAIREPYMVNNKPSDFDIDKVYYDITKNLDFNKNIEPIDFTNLTKPTILGRIKGWLGSVKKEEGGTIEAQNGGYLQSDTPEHAAALAARKTTRVPWPGVGRRRMGAAMDNNGGKYLYERGDVNGNTAQTSVSIPAPGDTIVRQSVATMDGWNNRTYPEGTDEYESVMKRFRPFIEYGIPAKQEGGEISRRDMFNQANENRGFNRSVTRTAYANALNGLRAGGLRGRELRQAARKMVIGQPAVEETIVETTTREPLGTLTKITPLGSVQTSLPTQLAPTSTESYDLDSMSFNDAFATMRKAGKPRFVWNGKVYTTELAEPKQGPALWGDEGFMWNDTRYAVPYGEARLRNTFLRKLGGKINK